MRSNQNPSNAVNRGAGPRGLRADTVNTESIQTKSIETDGIKTNLSLAPMPVEWLDAGTWRLPSGKALAEFALQAGFLAPLLFRADGSGKTSSNESGMRRLTKGVALARNKHFGAENAR